MKIVNSEYSDIYLKSPTKGRVLKEIIGALAPDLESGLSYSGFVGLNLKRLNGLMGVMRLKKNGIEALNVPLRYRDQSHISFSDAQRIASELELGAGVAAIETPTTNDSPLYWSFGLAGGDGARVGGRVAIDRVDGHSWSVDELNEYAHDFNNAFWVT